MEQNAQQKTYKRHDRSVPDDVRKRISDSLKAYNANHPRPDSWCKSISDSLRADTGGYWSHIPPSPKDDDSETGMADIIL